MSDPCAALDSAVIAELRGDDPEGLAVLLHLVATDVCALRDGLKDAGSRADVTEAGRLAHELRGVAANAGATEVAALAGRLQQALMTDSTRLASFDFRHLDAACERLTLAVLAIGGSGR